MYRIVSILTLCLVSLMHTTRSGAESGIMLSLDEAIRFALTHNIDLQTSRDRVEHANISLEAAQSEFGFKIQPDVSGLLQQGEDVTQQYGLQVSKRLDFGADLRWDAHTRINETLEESHLTELSLSYTQPLLKGRGTLAATAELASAERATRSQYRALLLAQQQLVVNITAGYYDIVRDRMLLEVNERALARAKLLLHAAEARLKVGMASKMDVFRAELQVLTAEGSLIDAGESLENAKRRFNQLLGAELDTEFSLTTELAYQPISIDKQALLQQALSQRLELEDLADHVTDAERKVKIAKQNLWPPLDVSVHYTLSGEGDGFEESLELQDSRWGIGLNSTFNLDLARDRASYQQAQLNLNGVQRNIQIKEQQIQLEVLQTINSVNQAQARVHLQEQSMVQAQKQLELAELRYKKGLSDNLDVIEAEEAFVKANTSYYSAVVQHVIAKMRLKQVTGTLDVPF